MIETSVITYWNWSLMGRSGLGHGYSVHTCASSHVDEPTRPAVVAQESRRGAMLSISNRMRVRHQGDRKIRTLPE